MVGGSHDSIVRSGARRSERGHDDRCDERDAQSGQSPGPLFNVIVPTLCAVDGKVYWLEVDYGTRSATRRRQPQGYR
jgi:hypothetical protein